MKHVTKQSTILFTTLLGVIVLCTYLLLQTTWCKNSEVCNLLYTSDYLGTFIYSSIGLIASILPITLLMVPLSTQVFENWKKFALISTPIMIIATHLIINMQDSGGALGGPSIHLGTLLLPLLYSLFFFISLIIIGVSAFRSRNKS